MLYYNSHTERCNEDLTTPESLPGTETAFLTQKFLILKPLCTWEKIIGRNCKQTVPAQIHIVMTSQSATTASLQIM